MTAGSPITPTSLSKVVPNMFACHYVWSRMLNDLQGLVELFAAIKHVTPEHWRPR